MNPLELTQIRPSQRSARRTLSLVRRLAPALLLGLAPLLSPAQTRVVQAADICPGGSGSVVACVVNIYTGPGTWTWTVPAGVTSVTVDAFGAQGGEAAGVKGGLGGEATATLAVTPGATYQINVGGYGGSDQMRAAGGYNGGGAGGVNEDTGGIDGQGGGGASDVRSGSFGLSDRVIVAGGGGGTGGQCSGCNPPIVGGPGGDTGAFSRVTGTLGVGGAGSAADASGGGGGGGYFGGAGGSGYGPTIYGTTNPPAFPVSGRGGSNFGPAGAGLQAGVQAGNGKVTIWYTYAAVPTTTTTTLKDLAGARVQQGGKIYLIDNDGTKRYIPDPTTYTNLFRDWSAILQFADVGSIPSGPPITSGAYLAIAQETMQTVYLVDNGQKRGVTSPAVMDKFYFNWNQIRKVPQSTLDALPTGAPLT
ncbi:MAG TPA: hypothetical protein VGJ54_08110 [Streptosporangiaceae bacterium]